MSDAAFAPSHGPVVSDKEDQWTRTSIVHRRANARCG